MLQYNGVSLNSNPTGSGSTINVGSTYQPTSGSGSNSTSTFNSNDSSKGGFNWGDLFSALPGLANGAANIIAATKTGGPVYYDTNGAYQQAPLGIRNSGMGMWPLIIGAVVVVVLILLFTRKGAAAA